MTRSQLRVQNSQSCSRLQLFPLLGALIEARDSARRDCRRAGNERWTSVRCGLVVVLLAFAWAAALCFTTLAALAILACEVAVGCETSNVAWAMGRRALPPR